MPRSRATWQDAPDCSAAEVRGLRLKVTFERGAWSAFINGEYIRPQSSFPTREEAKAACEIESGFELRRRGSAGR